MWPVETLREILSHIALFAAKFVPFTYALRSIPAGGFAPEWQVIQYTLITGVTEDANEGFDAVAVF
jgi:hypothetical protein